MYLDSSSVFGVICENEEAALSAIYPFTAAAAMAGATLGSFFSLIYVSVYNSVKYNSRILNKQYKTSVKALKEIISFSAPIIISTIIQSVSTFLDNSSVQYCLSQCNFDKLKEAYQSCLQLTSTPDEDVVTYIFGLFSSAQDFKNLLPGLTMALGVAAVPAISAAFESHNRKGCRSFQTVSLSIHLFLPLEAVFIFLLFHRLC